LSVDAREEAVYSRDADTLLSLASELTTKIIQVPASSSARETQFEILYRFTLTNKTHQLPLNVPVFVKVASGEGIIRASSAMQTLERTPMPNFFNITFSLFPGQQRLCPSAVVSETADLSLFQVSFKFAPLRK